MGQKQDSFQCKYCEKLFSQISNLNVHIESIHDKKKHKCPICGYAFTEQGNMKKHIKKTHEGISKK